MKIEFVNNVEPKPTNNLMKIFTNPERIAREIVPNFKCINSEVLDSIDSCMQRKLSLQRAAQMSHNYCLKVKIVFVTEEGIKEVVTTIWAATENNVILKGGICIPVCCIKEVVLN